MLAYYVWPYFLSFPIIAGALENGLTSWSTCSTIFEYRMYLNVNGNSLQKIVFSIIQILFINFNAIYYAFILTPDLKCFFFREYR